MAASWPLPLINRVFKLIHYVSAFSLMHWNLTSKHKLVCCVCVCFAVVSIVQMFWMLMFRYVLVDSVLCSWGNDVFVPTSYVFIGSYPLPAARLCVCVDPLNTVAFTRGNCMTNWNKICVNVCSDLFSSNCGLFLFAFLKIFFQTELKGRGDSLHDPFLKCKLDTSVW